MMKDLAFEILFFASYPSAGVNEGMAQRILQIDEKFTNRKRVYVNASLFRFKTVKKEAIDTNILQVRINPLLHCAFLVRLLKQSSVVYFHSIYNYLHVFFLSLRKHVVVLDIHGVVPEENFMTGNKIKGVIYKWLERRLVHKTNLAICVSEKMKAYFREKYKTAEMQYLVLPIVQKDTGSYHLPELEGLKDEDVVFIYSGGLQKWQNIPLMLETIQKLSSKSYVFLFLTHQPEQLKQVLAGYNMNGHRIIVRSASKNELPGYYSISHYGFLLRDEHIVNEVACPTKMYEYLEGGITPILLSKKIGDYDDMGIDSLLVSDVHDQLPRRKSANNQQKVNVLRNKASVDLWNIVSSL